MVISSEVSLAHLITGMAGNHQHGNLRERLSLAYDHRASRRNGGASPSPTRLAFADVLHRLQSFEPETSGGFDNETGIFQVTQVLVEHPRHFTALESGKALLRSSHYPMI